MYVSAAFLYSRMNKPIYIDLPKGHKKKDGFSNVWETYSAIYGLHQAPRHWHRTVDDFRKKYGLVSCISEPCFYYKAKIQKIEFLLIVYVDDVLDTRERLAVEDWKKEISKRFQCRNQTE